MKADKIKAMLPALKSKQLGTRGKWILAKCPLASWNHTGNGEFAIMASDKKKSICKCLSCGFGGDIMDLIMKIREFQKKSAFSGFNLAKAAEFANNEFEEMDIDTDIPDYEGDFEDETADFPFPDKFLDQFLPLWKSPEGMAYMQSRGIPLKMCQYLDLVYDPVQKRVGFPFWNAAGKLMGVQGRAIDPANELRYYQYGYLQRRNMQCWMNEHRIDLDRPLVICEGPLDLAKIAISYDNVAASFTTGLSVAKLKRLSDASDIITFYDYGKGGNAARERIKQILPHATITDIIPTPEEEDAGAMEPGSIRAYLQEHVVLLPEGKFNP